MARQEENLGDVRYRVPILKICQSLTREVKSGDAEAGEFLNTLTGESYGTEVDFIVGYYQPGRAASDTSGKYYVAIEQDLIPESWAPLVGEEFVGTRFDEHPDAEEVFKRDVNAKVKPWGKGPVISTTYNYTGLVVVPGLEGSDEEDSLMPARVSFKRTSKAAHDKLRMLKESLLRNRPYWDAVFTLSTQEKTFGNNEAFIVNVKKARDTTVEEKTFAFEVAQAVVTGRTEDNSTEAEAGSARVAPDNKGGLDV